MIGLSAVLAGWQALHHLWNPPPVRHLGMVMAAGAIGAIGNEAVAMYRIRVGRASDRPPLVADGLHARTDGLTPRSPCWWAPPASPSGGDWADPVIGLVIAAAIVVVLVQAVRSVGERCSTAWTRRLPSTLPPRPPRSTACNTSVDSVQHVSELRARWVGHRLNAEVRVNVDRDVDVATAHEIAERVSDAVVDQLPVLAGAVVHVDPCRHGAGCGVRVAPSPLLGNRRGPGHDRHGRAP